MRVRRTATTLPAKKILVFDSECRPMHYSEWRAESQITGISWAWLDDDPDDRPLVVTLKQDLSNEETMLARFFEDFNAADIVVGHYIRKHDLPLLSDHAFRLGLEMKSPVQTQDTMMDLLKVKGLGKSQENLSVTLGLAEVKHHMTGADWRIANALTEEGRTGTRTRVVSDVEQNKALYRELRSRGALKAPKAWSR